MSVDNESETQILETRKNELAVFEKELNEIRSQHGGIKDTLGAEQKLYSEKERQIELVRKIMKKRRHALRELAK